VRLSYAPWGESIEEQAAAAVRAEDAGFTDLWVSELHRSAFVPISTIAQRTKRAGVGTAIALAFVRSPMTTALESLDVDEVSNGRFILGIGSGVQRLNEDWHNANFGVAVPHLRESIGIIREFWARSHLGETIEIAGAHERIRLRGYERPFPPARTNIPIYIAAVGEGMTRLAGEIGDGWIGHELGSPSYAKDVLIPNLQTGIDRGGRARSDCTAVASAVCVIDDDSKQAKRWAAGLVAFYATVRTYEAFFAFHGFEKDAANIRTHFKAGDEAKMIDACPDEMVDALTLAGTAGEVRAKLKEYEGIVDGVKLSPPTHLVPPEVTRAAQNNILEHLTP
jgi:probable F420-dependent oxidoreductase